MFCCSPLEAQSVSRFWQGQDWVSQDCNLDEPFGRNNTSYTQIEARKQEGLSYTSEMALSSFVLFQ